MGKFLAKANYVGKGVSGLMNEGGTSRTEAIASMVESVGGSVESVYYAFGPIDVYAIVELPDHASAAALSLIINASGAVKVELVVLMTPEEMDRATQKSPTYRPPGG
jgi:uncharacterized protein with GYD domain